MSVQAHQTAKQTIMPNLSGKTALVTGSSRGIGRASALALAAAGAQVLVHYGRGASEADGVVGEIRKAGGRGDAVGADLAAADVPRMRVICFLWTAPFLGLAGALVTLQKVRVAPSASFSITDWTIFIIFAVVIGGIGSLDGPIIGTALFLLLREYPADFGAWYLILLGAVSIEVILIEPRGLWGVWRRFFPIDVIPVSHKSPENMNRTDFAGTSRLERSHLHRAEMEEKA